jgi:hypothetical protein
MSCYIICGGIINFVSLYPGVLSFDMYLRSVLLGSVRKICALHRTRPRKKHNTLIVKRRTEILQVYKNTNATPSEHPRNSVPNCKIAVQIKLNNLIAFDYRLRRYSVWFGLFRFITLVYKCSLCIFLIKLIN